jgi:hypothetical protein
MLAGHTAQKEETRNTYGIFKAEKEIRKGR